jgi:hypothetical protein
MSPVQGQKRVEKSARRQSRLLRQRTAKDQRRPYVPPRCACKETRWLFVRAERTCFQSSCSRAPCSMARDAKPCQRRRTLYALVPTTTLGATRRSVQRVPVRVSGANFCSPCPICVPNRESRKKRRPRAGGKCPGTRGPQVVGETGFEPATPWSRRGARRITRRFRGWHRVTTRGNYSRAASPESGRGGRKRIGCDTIWCAGGARASARSRSARAIDHRARSCRPPGPELGLGLQALPARRVARLTDRRRTSLQPAARR